MLQCPQVVIPFADAKDVDGVVFYLVRVTPHTGSAPWTIQRRYSEFFDLREKLGMTTFNFDDAPFPPKLIFFASEADLQERVSCLEVWLRATLQEFITVQSRFPAALGRFLVDADTDLAWSQLFPAFDHAETTATRVRFLSGLSPEPLEASSGPDRVRAWLSSPGGLTMYEENLLPNVSAVGAQLQNCAKRIREDIPRTFAVLNLPADFRLRVSEMLVNYAKEDPELGYAQGMGYVAAAVCMRGSDFSEFACIIKKLRGFWMPPCELIEQGTLSLEKLLQRDDSTLLEHFREIGLESKIYVLGAWQACFASWLPMEDFCETIGIIAKEGFLGVLAMTVLLVVHNRDELLSCGSLEVAACLLSNLSTRSPPPRLASKLTDFILSCRATVGNGVQRA